MHTKQIIQAGLPLDQAKKVLIMLHGRGASAQDILPLGQYFNLNGFALLAPQATNHTWYPYSFMAPVNNNEPWLSAALSLLAEIKTDLIQQGFTSRDIYFLGFSQGACLVLEFVTRQADHYGGVVAFTGGLIGEELNTGNYQGDFNNTPVFIGTSNPDPHVPVDRVYDSAGIMKKMHADLTLKVYNGMGHTISREEVDAVNELLFS